MEQKLTLCPETALFIEALQAVLQAEEKLLEGYSLIYGDKDSGDGGKTGGEDMFCRSGITPLFEEVKTAIKTQIGEVVELSLRGLLSDPIKKEEE